MRNILRRIKILMKMAKYYIGYKLGCPRPLSCGFNVTYLCNLTCSFCPFFGKFAKFQYGSDITKLRRYEMTTAEAKYAIDQIEKLGVIYFGFNGGEPLLRNDLLELVQFAHKKNMVTALTTNGTLATKEIVKSFRGYFNTIAISIHGLGDLDDKIKGKKGSFKKSVEGLRIFKKYSGAKVGINFVINKYNYHQIEDMLNFAKENCDFISYRPVTFFPEFFLEKRVAQEIGNKLLELKEKNETFIDNKKNFLQLFDRYLAGEKVPVKCIAFDLSLGIGPSGDFVGCCYPFSVGNILKTDAKILLKLGRSKKEEIKKRCGGSIILGCGECEQQSVLKDLQKMLANLKKIWKI